MAILSLMAAVTAQAPSADEPKSPKASTFGMSEAVACTRVDGLDQFTPLPKAELTSEDKLKVYFRPLHFKVERVEARLSRAAFTEDGRVRRKGEKASLSKEDKLLEVRGSQFHACRTTSSTWSTRSG